MWPLAETHPVIAPIAAQEPEGLLCSSARQAAPWVEQEGAGARQTVPGRGVGAAGMGKGWGTEPRCRRGVLSSEQSPADPCVTSSSHSKALQGAYCASIVTAQPFLQAR